MCAGVSIYYFIFPFFFVSDFTIWNESDHLMWNYEANGMWRMRSCFPTGHQAPLSLLGEDQTYKQRSVAIETPRSTFKFNHITIIGAFIYIYIGQQKCLACACSNIYIVHTHILQFKITMVNYKSGIHPNEMTILFPYSH